MRFPLKRDMVVASDLEEGEIEVVNGEEMVGQTDDDSDEKEIEKDVIGGSDIESDDVGVDEISGGTIGGSIKSKNELQVGNCAFDGILYQNYFTLSVTHCLRCEDEECLVGNFCIV